ncbi:Glycosyltransferase involved in cell wall bisynthesis [Paenibacillus sophorae]|uniref:Glycosyltransferase n=1 Tax=Paenibacillus sophorae TaxID=1333845 RepID=A0A1H8TSQ9_9BACL|nr:glycosyltransferase [Paenibacillus sophorae]QWU18016.1 glycosyltransferase [Paenibacillus sophorae]SEO94052.1 Glycosyltransferase involved in cell wall bisynthesis [Paenibacillus sophorae]
MDKISIVTPCYNAEKYIMETVQSVITQTAVDSGRVELEYIICDGGSTDRTIELINSVNSGFIKIISEPDAGMYHALSKGFQLATGDICAYLNAGDYYSRHAFDVVLDLFETKPVKWLTGLNVSYNDRSQFVSSFLPFKYRKNLLGCGYYGMKLPFLQQESTFWSRKLNKLIDYDFWPTFKYAGDYYLWRRFSEVTELKIVDAYLGGFRFHKGQLSENLEAYFAEMRSIGTKPGIKEFITLQFDRLIWMGDAKLKKRLNRDGLFQYNHQLQKWE